MTANDSLFRKALEIIDQLTIEEQRLLVELLEHRLKERRRAELVANVAEAHAAYQAGNVRRGTVDDLRRDLLEDE